MTFRDKVQAAFMHNVWTVATAVVTVALLSAVVIRFARWCFWYAFGSAL
jgi:hypothetical protein